MLNSFNRRLGTKQGRIKPSGVAPFDGEYVFCLGYDDPSHYEGVAPGDFALLEQKLAFSAGTKLVRIRANIRPPKTVPSGHKWVVEALLDDVVKTTHDLIPGGPARVRYFSINVSNVAAGQHYITMRLRFVTTDTKQYISAASYECGPPEDEVVGFGGIDRVDGFGIPRLAYLSHADPPSIVSAEAHGTTILTVGPHPSAIASAEAMGAPQLNMTTRPSAIASAAAYGTPNTIKFASPSAIASSETFGTAAASVEDELLTIFEGPMLNGLRLTLETGVPVSTTDQTGKTTLYFTPYISGYIALYQSSVSKWVARSTAEISLALGTLTSGKNYDVFAYWTGSAVALELGSAWTDDTTRATALATQNGIYVKNGDAERRYVGTIRTTSTTQTEDSALKRFVWNGPELWRQVPLDLVVNESTDSWTYSTNTWRQARATSSNKVELVVGLSAAVCADVTVVAAGNSVIAGVGIGIDSTSTNSSKQFTTTQALSSSYYFSLVAKYVGRLTPGYHYIAWLENTNAGSTATFFGDDATRCQSGLTAQVQG